MNRLKCFLTILSVLCLSACSDEKERRQESQISDLSNQVAVLENQVAALSNQISSLSTDHFSQKWASLDLSKREVQRLDTSNGVFFISCEDVTPYLNGYKIHLKIGNVSMATYHGFKLNLDWGKAVPKNLASVSEAGLKELLDAIGLKQVSFSKELMPGTWNTVEVILSPVKPEELEYLEVSMETDNPSLAKPQPASE